MNVERFGPKKIGKELFAQHQCSTRRDSSLLIFEGCRLLPRGSKVDNTVGEGVSHELKYC